MKTIRLLSIAAALAGVVLCLAPEAEAQGRLPRRPWHGNYYDPAWGVPVAVVVPPNAERQIDYSWGVTNTEVSRIRPQFRRAYPYDMGEGVFAPTPAWPWHTNQFGYYYIRAPW